MVVISESAADHFAASFFGTCGVPEIDLSADDVHIRMVSACEEYGFFKVVNHGVPSEVLRQLEEEAFAFFGLPQDEKDEGGPPDPFGYGTKTIGSHGDVGWIEFLLLATNRESASEKSNSFFRDRLRESFRHVLEEYVTRVKELTIEVLELIADGLGIEERDALSMMVRDKRSDGCFRVNHYTPIKATIPCEHHENEMTLELMTNTSGRRNLVGFGEHTDPQIISVLRSNDVAGLEIWLRDGSWVSVPSDQSSFFVCVGDTLQVLTNGRFKSVKHRVLVHDHARSRLSMIYFGSPPLYQKISPLPCMLSEQRRGADRDHRPKSLYKEFTWSEYKYSAYKTKLAHDRLSLFEISPHTDSSN